ncbi:MAG: aminodeoxychorismate synthase component I [Alphaproteobacteria bacterium]
MRVFDFHTKENAGNAAPKPQDVFAVFSDRAHILYLDSADRAHPDSRYSFVMFEPDAVISSQTHSSSEAFAAMRALLSAYKPAATHSHAELPPFIGGLAGFLGYDLGRALEDLPSLAKADPDLPEFCMGLYSQLYAYDHKHERGMLITHERAGRSDDSAEGDAQSREQDWLAQFQAAQSQTPPLSFTPVSLAWRENFTQSAYEDSFARITEYICAGDIFQANMTRRFDAPCGGVPAAAHYLNLRQVNPAPFAGYFDAGACILSSASPERFLRLDKSGRVIARPIKGTARQDTSDPQRDIEQREALLSSAKNRAENIMIVDLMRNDLARSCAPHSIEVPELCVLESFAGLHHLVSTVSGQLAADKDVFDLLAGCFPGGSITGAPKIRAMEIIEELEPTRRGAYCGAMGYIGFDGAMDMNILIRTLVYKGDSVSFQVGGGIVTDSDPAEEYAETLTKAHKILESFTRINDVR